MTRIPITQLFNAYDLQVNPLEEDKIRSQEVVNYCEARFRVALQAMMARPEKDQRWMFKILYREMEFCFSHIGVAAAIGQPLNIPVIVRSLGQDMYRVGMIPDRTFRPGLELMSYLDGNLSSNGPDDPALGIQLFYLPWWTDAQPPTGKTSYFCSSSLKSALAHYREQLAEALIPLGVPHTISNLANELNKPAYTWHSSVNDNMPNNAIDCTRCRLYRAVGVGAMDQLRDMYNMVNACESANAAERDIAIRRASGFNELYEAALKKETASASRLPSDQQSGSHSTGEAKGKQRYGPEVENLKALTRTLVRDAAMASSKWTWGVDLTHDDLRGLIRGADRQDRLPHSGYDEELISVPLQSHSSGALDPVQLEDPNDPELHFDDLSRSITMIPELPPYEIPTYLEVLVGPGDDLTDPEPDPVIEAFSKRAKAEAIKANKVLMQDEVDQPVSYGDYGSEFVPRTALIPRRPWLVPHIPIILPPLNIAIRRADSDNSGPLSDPIETAESDANVNSIPDSDIDLPHSDDISNSSPSAHLIFPVSDDEISDAMDVVGSDEIEIPVSDIDSGSAIDDIVFPESPIERRAGMGGSGVMVGIERDPTTGRFTAQSFANFPDEMLD